MHTVLLSSDDVKKLLTMRDAIDVVEKAFREKGMGRVEMPPKSYVFFEEYGGDFRTMPAYIEALGAAGVKVVNVHPGNKRRGLPTVMAVIVLLDPRTGYPVAMMDGTFITNVRTGASGVIAAKYLARRDSGVVGMVGSGTQARFQLMALVEHFRIDEVRVWSKHHRCAEKYVHEMGERLGLNVRAFSKIEDVVMGADIVVTTTPSRSPLVKCEWISKGTHINAIGADAPGKQELDPEILSKSRLVVDDMEQAVHSGEVNVPISRGEIGREHIYAELGEIVCGKKEGRISEDEVTVFDSTGLAIQDISTAALVYRRAVKRGMGRKFNILSL